MPLAASYKYSFALHPVMREQERKGMNYAKHPQNPNEKQRTDSQDGTFGRTYRNHAAFLLHTDRLSQGRCNRNHVYVYPSCRRCDFVGPGLRRVAWRSLRRHELRAVLWPVRLWYFFVLRATGIYRIGLDVFESVLMQVCGYLTGLIFRAVAKHDKTKTLCYFAASLATPLLNTLLFMGALLLCFWHMDLFTAKMAEWGLPTGGVFIFLISFIGINGAIEAAVNFLAGGAVAKAVGSLQRRRA